MNKKEPEGTHLMVDGKCRNKELISDTGKLSVLLEKLAEETGMKIITQPIVVKGTARDGITGIMVIEESHIAIHTFTEFNLVWIDIFSCKEFDTERIVEYLRKEFRFDSFRKKVLVR